MAQSEKTVGCYLAERLHEPDVEYWRSSTSQQELLSKPPHEAVFIDGPEQVVPTSSNCALCPMRTGGTCPTPPAWTGCQATAVTVFWSCRCLWSRPKKGSRSRSKPRCRRLGRCGWRARTCHTAARCFRPRTATSFSGGRCRWTLEHRRRRSRWESHKEEYVEVRYAPRSARRSLHARRHLAKQDAVSVTELCHLIDALADEARSAGHLTGYRPTSWPRAGVQTLLWSLNAVLAVHRTICGRWAYRQNPQYLRFVQHARATQRVTLRKFRDQGFRAWLQRELRSRAVKRTAATAGTNHVGHCPSWRTSSLRLPFDAAQAAEASRTGTANGRRFPRR